MEQGNLTVHELRSCELGEVDPARASRDWWGLATSGMIAFSRGRAIAAADLGLPRSEPLAAGPELRSCEWGGRNYDVAIDRSCW